MIYFPLLGILCLIAAGIASNWDASIGWIAAAIVSFWAANKSN